MRFPIPVFFVCFVLFTLFLAYKRNKQTRNQDNANTSFLERERLANATRKQDISHLEYLPFSAKMLPVSDFDDEELRSLRAALEDLSEKRIIDLSAYSNTDLKLMYGPANLNALSEYDDNYHLLSSTLLAYASRELEQNRTEDAVCTLEYAMQLHIGISQIYLLLAELYQKQNKPEKIGAIRDALSQMDERFASGVLAKLDGITGQ